MAGQTLTTTILINARTGNGFSQVGNTLTELGSVVDGLSQKLLGFGEDSIKVYRNYEKSMTDAEVALSTTYGRGTRELNGVMSQLDAAATEWAATTIFHTNDVGNAISEAAHAGWDFDQIMSGIPAAMQLAQAGSIDLSDAVNYIVKATSAAGIEFGDLGNFIDEWAFSANSSASTIDEFGQAMLRMGSTMRFAGSTEELMTLIAVTANAGSVGSEAGTMIRNSMIRLIAPTDKAKEAMELLGATSEETAGLMEDQELAAANARLAAEGFSAYDSKGNLKNILDIYRELYVALGEVAGGFENIETNEDALGILSAIFPTRTITEALTLLRGAADGYDGLYDAMQRGDAEGYGAYAAETMMDTLDGRILTFESKIERLQQLVGENLAPQAGAVMDVIGGIADAVSGLDETKFNMLIRGLEGVALAGPGMLAVGGALRFIGLLSTSIGLTAVSLTLAAGAMGAMYEMAQSDLWGKFGNMELDTSEFSSHIQGLASDFETAYGDVNSFNTALETAMQDYTNASSTFSSRLLTSSLTELTDEDISNLEGLGDQMYQSILDGINNNYAADMTTINNAFGGLENAEGNTTWAHIIEVLNLGYESAIAQAEELSQRLRNAMTSAFADGQLTGEEVSNIMSIIEEQNELMAMQTNAENYAAQQRMLRKAQTAGLDSLQEISQLELERQNGVMEGLYADQEKAYGTLAAQLDYWVEHGTTLEDGTVITREYADQMLAELRQRQAREAAGYHLQFAPFTMGLYDQIIGSSDLADTWGGLGTFAESRMAKGTVTQSDLDTYLKTYSESERLQIADITDWYVEAMGGVEQITRDIDTLLNTEGKSEEQRAADIQTANELTRLLTMQELSRMMGYGATAPNEREGAIAAASGYNVEDARAQVQAIDESTSGMMGAVMDSLGNAIRTGVTGEFANLMSGNITDTGFQSGLDDVVAKLGEVYDLSAVQIPKGLESIRDYAAAYELMFGNINPEDYLIQPQVEPVVDRSEIDAEFSTPISVPIQTYTQGEDRMTALQEQGVEVSVDGDVQELQADITGTEGQTLVEYLDGDATDLHMVIMDENGLPLTERVYGNTAALASAIAAYQNRTITVNIRGRNLFAEGGRATTASIFGEAGPEWAIPEEHSERTARLLDAARAASGFTWSEIIGRFGGLNANPDNTPTTIVYSPTINAQNASGVEQVLRDDKRRMEKWFEEKQMRDRAEVYA